MEQTTIQISKALLEKLKMRKISKKEMRIAALSSGSSGNCFYIANDSTGVLIDAGISARQIAV